jgi:copper resistance protein B
LLAIGGLGRAVTALGRRVSVRRGAGAALVAFGVWTIVGPALMPHAGHGAAGGATHAEHGATPAAHDGAAGHAGHGAPAGDPHAGHADHAAPQAAPPHP